MKGLKNYKLEDIYFICLSLPLSIFFVFCFKLFSIFFVFCFKLFGTFDLLLKGENYVKLLQYERFPLEFNPTGFNPLS